MDKVLFLFAPADAWFLELMTMYALYFDEQDDEILESPLFDFLGFAHVDNNHCFVCGSELDSQNRTDEHVFPRWLSRKYNLMNPLSSRIVIPHEKPIKYSAKLPCCYQCNQVMGNLLEKVIHNAIAFDGAYDNAVHLSQNTWFYWANKISYGLACYENYLVGRNVKNKACAQPISEGKLLKQSFGRMLLKNLVRNGIEEEALGSVFVFNITDSEENFFGYKESLNGMFEIILGKIGVLVGLHDGNCLRKKLQTEDIVKRDELSTKDFRKLYQFCDKCLEKTINLPRYYINFDDSSGKTEYEILPAF